MSDGYLRKRQFYGDLSGSLSVTPFTNQTVLVTCRVGDALHIQRLHVHCTIGLAGASWVFQDSAGVPVMTVPVAATTTDPSGDQDFGQDGFVLTPGASLVFVPSAPGASGIVTWDAFSKLTT